MHARQAVEPLVEVLRDVGEEDKVRAGAAVSLGWIGDAQASEPLAEV
ncbi:MAG: HEAT repeat domain-containing protein [Actinobacteria bacterium]|nr:HEAT repeat domain-containing protein [Actinomycetota bacterium]